MSHDIGRTGGRGQRRDQCAKEGADVLDRYRGGDDNRRSHRHLECELAPEQQVRRHRPAGSCAREFHLNGRAALDGLVHHAIALGKLEQLIELVLGRIGIHVEP